jgi:hypothetical protein
VVEHAGPIKRLGGDALRRLAVDAALAGALAAALLVVVGVDRSATPAPPPDIPVQVVEREKVVEQTAPKRLRLAVTPPVFDDMGRLFQTLGEGYAYDTIQLEELADPQRLSGYDVVFLTCGSSTVSGANPSAAHQGLRSYVEGGGTVYASDWRFQFLEQAFPEFINPTGLVRGAAQELQANVVDKGLQEVLGQQVTLTFDLGGWYPAAFQAAGLKVFLTGAYRADNGETQASAPLLVKIKCGGGAIVFTSFHNEKVNSETEQKLLQYLVSLSVIERADAKVRETMVSGGFSPRRESLLNTSPGADSVTKHYQCDKPGRLEFALAFEERGARLQLQVVGPDGQVREQEGTSTFKIVVEQAQAGEWTYTLNARQVPFENFPFTLTVWQR